ncbi:hypothetical protein [Neorhodopirellula lusitana]|uniref:hypothetical protein n=1 Tax=Neorhodopirellula lusitana TaxID=445327 RepID=UPI00384E61DF
MNRPPLSFVLSSANHVRLIVAMFAVSSLLSIPSIIHAQGFNLAPAPKTPSRTNRPGFTPQSNSLFSSPNVSRNNTNAQIASGIIGVIGAGLQAANRSSQSNPRRTPNQAPSRGFQLAPNSSGPNNRNGYNSQSNLFRQPSRQYVQPSPNRYRTAPSTQYRTVQPSQQYVQQPGVQYVQQPSQQYVQQPSVQYTQQPTTSYPAGQTVRYSDGSTGVIYSNTSSSSPTAISSVPSSSTSSSTVISGTPTPAPLISSARPVISGSPGTESVQTSGSSVVSSSASTPSNQPPSLSELQATLPVILRCPDSEVGIFAYQLIRRDSGKIYDYTMTPGQKQEFKAGSRWKIRFDLGQGKGTKTYDLAGGTTYQIRKNGDSLWGVYAE